MKTSVRYGFSVCPGVQECDFYIDTNFLCMNLSFRIAYMLHLCSLIQPSPVNISNPFPKASLLRENANRWPVSHFFKWQKL